MHVVSSLDLVVTHAVHEIRYLHLALADGLHVQHVDQVLKTDHVIVQGHVPQDVVTRQAPCHVVVHNPESVHVSQALLLHPPASLLLRETQMVEQPYKHDVPRLIGTSPVTVQDVEHHGD
jgi:hypothetical protein